LLSLLLYRLDIDLDKIQDNQVRLRHLVVRMVADGLLSLDEYYDLLVVASDWNGPPWRLIKYYLLAEVDESSFLVPNIETKASIDQPYKARLVSVGKAIRDSYIARKS
jgi:hypothetical protein